jgi:CDP-6-deoxy-D-xylo-4-hexulose-3-dehydrase
MENAISANDKIKILKFILFSNNFTNGKQVRKFEKQWSEWLGCEYSLFVSSGSTANLLLIAAIKEKYNLKDGDKVLVPACTWVTNISPIFQLGLEPVFCDINLDNFSFDEDQLNEISKIHTDIKVIFVTHLLGFAANNEIYKKIFPNALIIDDVCESHGACFDDGGKVGSDSLGATFSFYFGHHMTTIEGGMVCTNNKELYDLMKMKRSHGMARESYFYDKYASENENIDKRFLFITDGYNFRNHEICAVLGQSQLKRLNSVIEKRKNNYDLFCSILNKYSNLFYELSIPEGNSNFCFPMIVKNKIIYEKLKKYLDDADIEYRPVVSGNLLSHPFLKKYNMCINKNSYNVDVLENQGLYIGNNQFLKNKKIKEIEKIFNLLDNDESIN